MTGNEYRYAEKVLYGYRRNAETAARLSEELRMLREIGDVHGQSYGQTIRGGVGDPVARHVDEVMSLEGRLKRVMRRVKAVDRMREDLQTGKVITITTRKDLLLILDEYYISGITAREFVSKYSWSRSMFYVRRRELVMIAGEYLRA